MDTFQKVNQVNLIGIDIMENKDLLHNFWNILLHLICLKSKLNLTLQRKHKQKILNKYLLRILYMFSFYVLLPKNLNLNLWKIGKYNKIKNNKGTKIIFIFP